MADSHSRKRALEILADPKAKEHEWMGALAILDYKIPERPSKSLNKLGRFLKRVSGLSLVYMLFFSVYGLIFYGSGFYWSMVPIALVWATLEASFGAFTLLAALVMLGNLGSILSLSPHYQSTWMIIAINLFIYARFNWRPYILVPVARLGQICTKSNKLAQIEQKANYIN